MTRPAGETAPEDGTEIGVDFPQPLAVTEPLTVGGVHHQQPRGRPPIARHDPLAGGQLAALDVGEAAQPGPLDAGNGQSDRCRIGVVSTNRRQMLRVPDATRLGLAPQS